MTRGRERRERGRRTMQRLLDAANEVFADRGYHAARVDDVVRAAHTSHGTFYLYFANKEDLFRALAADVQTRLDELAAEFPDVTAADGSQEAVRAWLERFVDLYQPSVPVFRSWTEAETWTAELGGIRGDPVSTLARRIADRLRDTTDLDPETAAAVVAALIERTTYLFTNGALRTQRAALLDTLATTVHEGLLGGTRRVGAR